MLYRRLAAMLFAAAIAVASTSAIAGLSSPPSPSWLPSTLPGTNGFLYSVVAAPTDANCNGSETASSPYDCSAAINNAATTKAKDGSTPVVVHLPAGGYYIQNPIQLSGGQTLQGDGHGNTTIYVGPGFNSSAPGVVELTGRGQGTPTIEGITFVFAQPADITTTAASTVLSGGSSITVNSVTGHGYTATTGDIVYDSTASVGTTIPNQTTISSITGSGPYTINLSTPLVGTVTLNDTIGFAPPRSSYATLASGCGTGVGCKYPPTVYTTNSNFFTLDDVWIIGAWDGINATNSNGGGVSIRNTNIEALDAGIVLDNITDYAHIHNVKCNRTFGIFSPWGPYADGSTLCEKFGRIDGLAESDVNSFLAGFATTSGASSSEDDWTLSNRVIDSGSFTVTAGAPPAIHVDGGSINEGAYGIGETQAALSVAVGRVFAHSFNLYTTTTPTTTAYPVQLSGGSLQLFGGFLENDGTDAGIVKVTGGSFTELGTGFVNHNASNTTPVEVAQTGSSGTVGMTGGSFGGGTGTPAGISIATDSASNMVSSVNLGSYTFTPPGPLGTYGPNKFSCPASFSVGTAGCEWTQTATSAAGSFTFTGLTLNGYDFSCQIYPGTVSTQLELQVNDGAWETSSYTTASNGINSAGTAKSISTTSGAGVLLSLADVNASGNAGIFVTGSARHLTTTPIGGTDKAVLFHVGYVDASGNRVSLPGMGTYATSSQVTGLRWLMSSGTLTGQCTLLAKDYE